MSPNFSCPATIRLFRRLRACSVTVLTLVVMASLATPQLFGIDPVAIPGMVVPPWQHIKISATLTPGTVGIPYSAVISINGGQAPYKFQAENLPAGLALNPQTGGLSGTPQAAG
ncbi:MAG TPA: Ig domain-containing protein, partial [Candidatus Sulfotelmatobacter sp.]